VTPHDGQRPAVFLDRDGVLNRAPVVDGRPHPPASAADLEVLPGVADACATLRAAGLLLLVVTNQPDVARGSTTREAVEEINAALRAAVPVDEILVCWHDDADGCGCRKPLPGLLVDAAQSWGISLPDSVIVGDRWRDIEAGRRAGCRTVFVDRGYSERRPEQPDLVVGELPDAVTWILGRTGAAR
jgi:D-glycero-D-manno-heptose 1,7-bisphosphate phosphatase